MFQCMYRLVPLKVILPRIGNANLCQPICNIYTANIQEQILAYPISKAMALVALLVIVIRIINPTDIPVCHMAGAISHTNLST